MPSADSSHSMLGCSRSVRMASEVSAMMPPSPLLSARVMKTTYLSETVMVIAQNTSERMPSTLSGVTGTGW